MLTITDFINILHRYYKSPMVSAGKPYVRDLWMCVRGVYVCAFLDFVGLGVFRYRGGASG